MSKIITAAVLVIGDEVLSGRTKDKNSGYIAENLTLIGVELKEIRELTTSDVAGQHRVFVSNRSDS